MNEKKKYYCSYCAKEVELNKHRRKQLKLNKPIYCNAGCSNKTRYNNQLTYEEEKKFIELYPKTSLYDMVKIFGLSKNQISTKAFHLGIKKKQETINKTMKIAANNRENNWSEEEIAFLKDNFSSLSWKELLKGLPNRTKSGISWITREKGISRIPSFNGNINDFKDIPNYDGKYKINKSGDIISIRNGIVKVMKTQNSLGYRVLYLSINGKRKLWKVHQLVALTFIPNPNNLPSINHIDENKSNNNVENLEWCTVQYNNTYGSRLQKARETRLANLQGINV